MSEHWRLRVFFHEEGHARALVDRLEAHDLKHDLSTAFHDRVFVYRHGAEVLCYAGDEQQARRTEALIESLATEHGWHIRPELRVWDDVAARFVFPTKRIHDAAHGRKHREAIAEERASSLQHGFPDWEVKVECPTHHDVIALAHQLTDEGIPTVHRWKYLVLGALDEDSGKQLASRVEREAPPGTTTSVEASRQAVLASMPPNPFAVFGGLAG